MANPLTRGHICPKPGWRARAGGGKRMLGRRTREARSGGSVTETFVGKGTRIEGTVVAEGTLRIEGEVVGEVRSEGDVFIAETGDVKASVQAQNLTVSGRLTGTATVVERLE